MDFVSWVAVDPYWRRAMLVLTDDGKDVLNLLV